MPTPFASAVRAHRRRLDLTQADLAERFGVRLQTISQWERSLKHPQARFHEELATFLGLNGVSALRALLAQRASGSDAVDDEAPLGEIILLNRAATPSARHELRGSRGGQDAPTPTDNQEADRATDADELVKSAVSIIDAKAGQLSPTESEIVNALLKRAATLGK